MRCWIGDRYAVEHWCYSLHGVCGGAVQRDFHSTVRNVLSWLDYEHAGTAGSLHVHSMCGWAVQSRISDSVHGMCVRLCDERSGWYGGHLVHCLCGGPGELQLDSGVCGLQHWAVSEQHRQIELLHVCIWIARGHHVSTLRGGALGRLEWSLRGVCRWAVSAQRWAVELPGMSAWLCDQYIESDWRSPLHGVCGGVVQWQRNCGVR